MFVLVMIEVVNLSLLSTSTTVMDAVMNFLCLVIIAEFDEYFFYTVKIEPPFSLFVNEIETEPLG